MCLDDGFEISNKEIKSFLTENLPGKIQFCESHRKNESQFVISSKVHVSDFVNILRSLDVTETAAGKMRKCIQNLDFNLDEKFCDTKELEESWYRTHIPDELLAFFSVLFTLKKTSLLKCCIENGEEELMHEHEHETTMEQGKVRESLCLSFK